MYCATLAHLRAALFFLRGSYNLPSVRLPGSARRPLVWRERAPRSDSCERDGLHIALKCVMGRGAEKKRGGGGWGGVSVQRQRQPCHSDDGCGFLLDSGRPESSSAASTLLSPLGSGTLGCWRMSVQFAWLLPGFELSFICQIFV